jgi:hypothetical protein
MKKALALAGLICMVASVSAGRLWRPNRLAFVASHSFLSATSTRASSRRGSSIERPGSVHGSGAAPHADSRRAREIRP